ncbi:hypothetical protein B0H13DRAFT_1925680 [Mycena leptocephala]|nr:hypothetical protein B0H13DRAFT_1925680 [Mycena leptocephala]
MQLKRAVASEREHYYPLEDVLGDRVVCLIWQGVDVGGPGARAHDDEQPECWIWQGVNVGGAGVRVHDGGRLRRHYSSLGDALGDRLGVDVGGAGARVHDGERLRRHHSPLRDVLGDSFVIGLIWQGVDVGRAGARAHDGGWLRRHDNPLGEVLGDRLVPFLKRIGQELTLVHTVFVIGWIWQGVNVGGAGVRVHDGGRLMRHRISLGDALGDRLFCDGPDLVGCPMSAGAGGRWRAHDGRWLIRHDNPLGEVLGDSFVIGWIWQGVNVGGAGVRVHDGGRLMRHRISLGDALGDRLGVDVGGAGARVHDGERLRQHHSPLRDILGDSFVIGLIWQGVDVGRAGARAHDGGWLRRHNNPLGEVLGDSFVTGPIWQGVDVGGATARAHDGRWLRRHDNPLGEVLGDSFVTGPIWQGVDVGGATARAHDGRRPKWRHPSIENPGVNVARALVAGTQSRVHQPSVVMMIQKWPDSGSRNISRIFASQKYSSAVTFDDKDDDTEVAGVRKISRLQLYVGAEDCIGILLRFLLVQRKTKDILEARDHSDVGERSRAGVHLVLLNVEAVAIHSKECDSTPTLGEHTTTRRDWVLVLHRKAPAWCRWLSHRPQETILPTTESADTAVFLPRAPLEASSADKDVAKVKLDLVVFVVGLCIFPGKTWFKRVPKHVELKAGSVGIVGSLRTVGSAKAISRSQGLKAIRAIRSKPTEKGKHVTFCHGPGRQKAFKNSGGWFGLSEGKSSIGRGRG